MLTAAIGRYPHTTALLDGKVGDPRLDLRFADVKPISRAFAPMVRDLRYDVSEMAIATFLQAKAYGKDIVLLPIVLAARFQEAALLCLASSAIRGPADLAGKRIGVRAYSQTTGVWLRGVLHDQHGISPEQIRWITFEDAHVAEYRDPPWAERAPIGAELLGLLHAGDVDAIVVGNEVPDDPAFRTVFPDPAAAGTAFWNLHHLIPVNHLVTIRGATLRKQPNLAAQLIDLFGNSKAASANAPPELLIGRATLQPAIELAVRYTSEQGLLPGPFTADEVWAGLPSDIS
ncbi:ABC transporter substrate-binding protein [Acidisphaera sp. L21]|uniref:ABC transporter substrate-binding protein n=1 Tax=Acidisphaera sp. L21 TaxID=1641851 RepID=UPI0020B1378C|nr:ABC transporter substrate-binding protein [Acidisphaera sp. L21]